MIEFVNALILLILASIVNFWTDKYKLPYTIILFLVGILIIPIQNFFGLNFIELTLSPELLFYVFLPVLIFESGYEISYRKYSQNSVAIWLLAIVGLLISAGLISVLGYYLLDFLGFHVSFIVVLLFGVIISSTDPVAVLSIFKTLGVPHRLRLLFEGESLFNDGTAVALFFVVLEIAKSGIFNQGVAIDGFLSFLSMVIGGIFVGSFFGFVFSKGIKYIKNNEAAEITLTIVLAHLTFIFCEYVSHHIVIFDRNVQISGVIATAFAAIIMGNYGKAKISPKVEKYMHKFRSFFSFLANSLIFLLMGLSVWAVSIPFKIIIIPIFAIITIVAVARAISIYFPLSIFNKIFKHQKISKKRLHLLAWGDLRGVLALTLVFLIPEDLFIDGWILPYSPKDVILAFTIGVILFSLIVKGMTIKPLIKRLKIDTFKLLESFEHIETEIFVYNKICKKIKKMKNDPHTCKLQYDELLTSYEEKLDNSKKNMIQFINSKKECKKVIKQVLALHTVGIEIKHLKTMYSYNEINEHIYIYLLAKLSRQQNRLERGETQIQPGNEHNIRDNESFLIKFFYLKYYRINSLENQYLINRTKFLITGKVIKKLNEMKDVGYGFDSNFDELSSLYKDFHQKAQDKIENLKKEKPDLIYDMNKVLLSKTLMKVEEDEINNLLHNQIITEKIHQRFKDQIEDEITKDYCC